MYGMTSLPMTSAVWPYLVGFMWTRCLPPTSIFGDPRLERWGGGREKKSEREGEREGGREGEREGGREGEKEGEGGNEGGRERGREGEGGRMVEREGEGEREN